MSWGERRKAESIKGRGALSPLHYRMAIFSAELLNRSSTSSASAKAKILGTEGPRNRSIGGVEK
jgi:hypothetical protein